MRASRLRAVLRAAAGVPEVSARLSAQPALTLRVTGDRELRRLNRQFLGEDAVTDVLSFPAGEDAAEPGYLGDIALSWPAVLRQSAEPKVETPTSETQMGSSVTARISSIFFGQSLSCQ